MRNFIPLAVGALLDIIDWLAVGFIPILGDIIDIAGSVYFYKMLGPLGAAGLIELIPGLDILPTFTLLGAAAVFKKRGRS